MYWIIVVGLIILAFAFLKMNHLRHKSFLITLIIMALFIYVTFSNVVKDNDIDIKSLSGVDKASRLYFVWLGGFFDNLKVITSNVVKMDWESTNKTDIQIIEEEK